jgi:hypothetical protein
MSDKKGGGYNGWTNYETWNIALWINNDEGEYEYWQDTAQEILKNSKRDKYSSKEDNARITLANEMEDHFKENAEDALKEEWKVSTYSDLRH